MHYGPTKQPTIQLSWYAAEQQEMTNQPSKQLCSIDERGTKVSTLLVGWLVIRRQGGTDSPEQEQVQGRGRGKGKPFPRVEGEG